MAKIIGILIAFICLCTAAFGCSPAKYVWNQVTSKAAYPQGYNYPVFVMDGEMRALTDGGWVSKDGKNWAKTDLANIGLNSAYQKFVEFNGAIYALGALQGNYLSFQLSTKISRTTDFKTWETVATRSNLPNRIFYGATVFKDKIWLAGGFDGKKYYNDVWNSADGVNWQRVAEQTAWTPRDITRLFIFNDRIWFMGGGVIDGEKTNNPNSEKEIWSSADGVSWTEVKINAPRKLSGTPVVFDDKLWLIGGNRNDGNFSSAVFVSEDGINWQERSAPWTPRGGVAVWISGGKLFMTGGKYSYTENGEIKFVYSNDVWAMSRKTE